MIACKLQYETEQQVEGNEGSRWYLHTGDRESAANVYDIRIMRAWVFLLRHTAYTCQPKRSDLSEADLSLQTHIHARASVYTRAYSGHSLEEILCRWHREFRICSCIWVHRCVELFSRCHSFLRFLLFFRISSIRLLFNWMTERTNEHPRATNKWLSCVWCPDFVEINFVGLKDFPRSAEFSGISRILHCGLSDATEKMRINQLYFLSCVYRHF